MFIILLYEHYNTLSDINLFLHNGSGLLLYI